VHVTVKTELPPAGITFGLEVKIHFGTSAAVAVIPWALTLQTHKQDKTATPVAQRVTTPDTENRIREPVIWVST
jgi:hypothetical protein